MKSAARFFVLTAAVALATTLSFRDAKPAFVPQAHAQLAGACGFLTDGIQAAYKYCSENGLGFSACASELKNKGIEVMKAAWDGIKGVWEWLKGLPGQVEGWMGTLWDFIKSVSPVKAYDYAKAKVSEVAGWASDLAAKTAGDLARNPKIKRVKSALSGVKSAFSNWSTFHPIDSANAIYNSFKELKDALYGAVSAAAGAAGSLANEALGKLNEVTKKYNTLVDEFVKVRDQLVASQNQIQF